MKDTKNSKMRFFGFTLGHIDSEKDHGEPLPNDGLSDNNNKFIIETSEENNKFELLKQLHGQFAENDNNKVTSVISFIAAIFAVFVGYGFCLYNYCFYGEKDNLLTPLLFSITASDAVLTLLAVLCLYFGYSTRRDNCFIHIIRGKYDVKTPYKDPFDRAFWNFLPDYYNIMFWSCVIFIIGISVLSLFVIDNFKWVVALVLGIAVILNIAFLIIYYDKFNEFKTNYKEKIYKKEI